MSPDTYTNRRTRDAHIFRPLARHNPVWKVEIKYAGASTYTDITNYCTYASVSHNSRNRLSDGTINLEDPNATFYNTIVGGEYIRVWAGYGAATYKEITARVIKSMVNFQPTTGYETKLTIRAWPELRSKKLSYAFDDVLVESAIGTILGNFSEVSYTAPGISTERLSMRFVSMDAITMIREICTKYGFEFFINAEGVADLFYSSTTANNITHDAIVLNQSLLSVTELGKNLDRMRNHIKVFGKQENFVMWLKSAQDDALISQYWQMDEEVFDSAILTNTDAEDRADKELIYRKRFLEEGRFKCMGMENITPGKQIYCAIPPLTDEWKVCRSVSHRFGEGWLTHFTIEFDAYDTAGVILERDKQIKGLQGIPLDKQYDESIVIDPTNDSAYISLTNLSISGGRIVTTDTAPSNGSFDIKTTLPGLTPSQNVVSAIVVVDGENLNLSTFTVSNDAGTTELDFENTELGTEQKSFNSIDNNIRISGDLQDLDSVNEVIIRRIAVYLKFE